MQYVKFSRITECRTCSESGLMLIIDVRWVSGRWVGG